jgi:hypothetical protein
MIVKLSEDIFQMGLLSNIRIDAPHRLGELRESFGECDGDCGWVSRANRDAVVVGIGHDFPPVGLADDRMTGEGGVSSSALKGGAA